MNRSTVFRRAVRLLTGFTVALVVAVAPVTVPAGPASAADPCGGLGHAYLITQSGTLFLSGCQGDERFGVRTVNLGRFDVVQLAGNRIMPGTRITFSVQFSDGSVETKVTTAAGNDSVVRQEPNTYFFTGSAPLGLVRFFRLVPGRQRHAGACRSRGRRQPHPLSPTG